MRSLCRLRMDEMDGAMLKSSTHRGAFVVSLRCSQGPVVCGYPFHGWFARQTMSNNIVDVFVFFFFLT